MNPLPPQAYTKETLLKAYSWLINQSDSIKEMATTPDILVSLYLKTTRDGESALDRPSIQNFKKELKSLAGLMGELDKAPSMPSILTQTAPMPSFQQNPPHNTPETGPGPATAPAAPAVEEVLPLSPLPSVLNSGHGLPSLLDLKTLAMIQEVKEDLNLSTEIEALRLLIKVGHARSKSLLK